MLMSTPRGLGEHPFHSAPDLPPYALRSATPHSLFVAFHSRIRGPWARLASRWPSHKAVRKSKRDTTLTLARPRYNTPQNALGHCHSSFLTVHPLMVHQQQRQQQQHPPRCCESSARCTTNMPCLMGAFSITSHACTRDVRRHCRPTNFRSHSTEPEDSRLEDDCPCALPLFSKTVCQLTLLASLN
jgi:hypothetical protein